MDKREQRKKRAIALGGLGLFLLFTGVVFWFVGKPMLQFVSQPDQFRDWVDTHGIWGRLAFLGMVMFQVFVAIIPGEPLEGYHNQQRGHFPGGEKVWHAVCHPVCFRGEDPLL